MNANKVRTLLVALLGTCLVAPAAADCRNPHELFGVWKDGGGPLTISFSPGEVNPFVGRMHNVVDPKLLEVGYRDGYPVIVMFEDRNISGGPGRVFHGDFAKRNRQGRLPPTPMRAKLVKDSQTFVNVLFLYFPDGNAWKARHTLFCADR